MNDIYQDRPASEEEAIDAYFSWYAEHGDWKESYTLEEVDFHEE